MVPKSKVNSFKWGYFFPSKSLWLLCGVEKMKNWSSVKKSKKKKYKQKKRKKNFARFCSTEKLSRLKVSFCHLILACVCFERAHARTETQVLRQKICQKFWARKKGDIQYKQRMISYFCKKENKWIIAVLFQSKFNVENYLNLSKKKKLNISLMWLAYRKKSYLICDETTNFWNMM